MGCKNSGTSQPCIADEKADQNPTGFVSPCHFGPVSRDTEGGRVCWSEIREKTQSQGSVLQGKCAPWQDCNVSGL